MRAFAALLVLIGCSGNIYSPPLARFGLVEAPGDRADVADAITSANLLIAPDIGRHFGLGWKAHATNDIPVYAVSSIALSAQELVTTYTQCGCVIVQMGALRQWLAQRASGSAALDVDPNDFLIYMLLHEMGHVTAHGFDYESEPQQALGSASLNLIRTRQKMAEIRADQFAADMLRQALRQKGSDRGVTAAMVSMALMNLSWDLQADRELGDFGGTELDKPALFQDVGLSHPNLEWRILVVNDLVAGTPTSHELREEFERSRERSARRRP